MPNKYPLQWPEDWSRGDPRARQAAKFKTGLHRACQALYYELRLFGGGEAILSTNVPLRRDGLPYAEGDPDDPGAAVWFRAQGEQRVIACDRYNHVAHNVQALAKTVEAMRGIERWGAGQILKRTLAAFIALPAPRAGDVANRADDWPWWVVLGVLPDAPLAIAEAAWKQRMKACGGAGPEAVDANLAIEAARAAARKEAAA